MSKYSLALHAMLMRQRNMRRRFVSPFTFAVEVFLYDFRHENILPYS